MDKLLNIIEITPYNSKRLCYAVEVATPGGDYACVLPYWIKRIKALDPIFVDDLSGCSKKLGNTYVIFVNNDAASLFIKLYSDQIWLDAGDDLARAYTEQVRRIRGY